jgi:L-threonylcarbamoyladenylate synthase
MSAQVLKQSAENLRRCAQALQRGELVAMPTETVYGLAGIALDPQALARIFATKERPTFDPLIVHVALDLTQPRLGQLAQLVDLSQLSQDAQELVEGLLQTFWPGPLTLVLPRTAAVPDLATSGLPTVAVRMPRHPIALALIAAAGTPLAAPSANRFGRISPTSAQDVLAELGERIGLVLDGGPCEIGVESTVLAVSTGGGLTLLRPGGISRGEIEAVAGRTVALPGHTVIAAPGMLDSHYAPRKPLRMLPVALDALDREAWLAIEVPAHTLHLGLLAQAGDAVLHARRLEFLSGMRVTAVSLSRNGDLAEVAHGLFAGLRALDASDAQWLLAEPCLENRGLGHAITDRLRRASHQNS